jgi:DUF177 domain-containing protein
MRLPRQVDPRKLALQGAHFKGVVPTKDMQRLSAAVESMAAEAAVELAFSIDESRHVVLEGHFEMDVSCQCQRCLQPVDNRLQGDMLFGVVWKEDRVDVLPKRYDPWLIDSDTADLYGLVEDEILLSLPIVAYHEENACPGKGRYSTGEFDDDASNPFGVLAQLKK